MYAAAIPVTASYFLLWNPPAGLSPCDALAIAAQEGLRGTLDDAIVDATIAALKKRLEELETTSHVQRRKLVTILFMDTVGSTEMIRVLDPEDNLAIMGTALHRLADPVAHHGGRMTVTMGDGFMASFAGCRRTRRFSGNQYFSVASSSSFKATTIWPRSAVPVLRQIT